MLWRNGANVRRLNVSEISCLTRRSYTRSHKKCGTDCKLVDQTGHWATVRRVAVGSNGEAGVQTGQVRAVVRSEREYD